jgi:hypothetical protein
MFETNDIARFQFAKLCSDTRKSGTAFQGIFLIAAKEDPDKNRRVGVGEILDISEASERYHKGQETDHSNWELRGITLF